MVLRVQSQESCLNYSINYSLSCQLFSNNSIDFIQGLIKFPLREKWLPELGEKLQCINQNISAISRNISAIKQKIGRSKVLEWPTATISNRKPKTHDDFDVCMSHKRCQTMVMSLKFKCHQSIVWYLFGDKHHNLMRPWYPIFWWST